MVSLNKTAQCIGLSGRFGVVGDLFGYRTKGARRLSVVTQMRLLQGKQIHLNLIRTAIFDVSQQTETDLALQTMRDIYATVNVGVGRIQRFFIPPGHEVGHYLGLEHEDKLPDNLMVPSSPNGGKLYGGQGGVMVLHYSMNGGCGT
jgi:hypothetical protein